MANYCFGVEIEMIAKPHTVRDNLGSLHPMYYGKIAASLRKRGLDAEASDGTRKHPENYRKWWITRDGSLRLSGAEQQTLVPIEAVSPILSLRGSWQNQIDIFWTSFHAVFHTPIRSSSCGSHVHISKAPGTRFSLTELKIIAYGSTIFENHIMNMLMRIRTNNEYCKPNTQSSRPLQSAARSRQNLAAAISAAQDQRALCTLMQANRYVLWNFENTLSGCSGTIEFRGGRFLRGKYRTKWWIVFVVSLVHWLLKMRHIRNPASMPSFTCQQFYDCIRATAGDLGLGGVLPPSYEKLNETV